MYKDRDKQKNGNGIILLEVPRDMASKFQRVKKKKKKERNVFVNGDILCPHRPFLEKV